jgi:hypothetical protein
MINLQNPKQPPPASSGQGGLGAFELGENRVYFGLWALMKAPLLLSADLPSLDQAVIDIVNNTDVIAVNQVQMQSPQRVAQHAPMTVRAHDT